MTEPKPMASLSSSLLARKGAAKPAMRPQGFGGFNMGQPSAAAIEDLGWNDMGQQDAPAHSHINIGLTPEPRHEESNPVVASAVVEPISEQHAPTPDVVEAAEIPVVVQQQSELAAKVSAAVDEQPEQSSRVVAAKAIRTPRPSRASVLANGKAAFTLRLDADRHLRLRLASAVTNRSAQRLVTEALDAFLNSISEIEALAGQVPTRRATNGR